jgi:hypothetical protein
MVWKKETLWLLAVSCAAAVVLAASTTTGQSSPQTSPSTGGMMSTPMGGGMMARMEESDRRLDELVSTMNSATGQAKVDAIAAVVNELVTQHRQMHQRMMGQGMRGGMRMMGRGATSTTPGASTTPRP